METLERLRTRPYLTPNEAALVIARDPATIKRWIRNGLPVHVVGGQRYIRPTELMAWALDPTRPTRTT